MERKRIEETVFKAVRRQTPYDVDEVTEKTRVFDDLAFDSLDAVLLVMDLEKDLEVEIPDNDADEMYKEGSVKGMIDWLERKLKNEP